MAPFVTLKVQPANWQRKSIPTRTAEQGTEHCRIQHNRNQTPSSSILVQRGEKPLSPFCTGEAWAYTNSAKAFLSCLCQATCWLTFARMSQGEKKKCYLIIVLLLFDSGVLLKRKKHREPLISSS